MNKNFKLCPIGAKIKIVKSAGGNVLGDIVTVVSYAYWGVSDYVFTTKKMDRPFMWYICESLTGSGNETIPMGNRLWFEHIENPIVGIDDIDNFKIL